MTTSSGTDDDTASAEERLRYGVERLERLQQTHNWNAADQLLETLLAEFGELSALVRLRGAGLAQRGEVKEGLAILERSLETRPDDPILLCDIGNCHAKSGDYGAAIGAFKEAAEVAPNYAIAWANLGAAQCAQKEFDTALINLGKAAELDPSLIDVHKNLGTVYANLRRPDLAVTSLFKALAIDPNAPGIHSALSAALYQSASYDTAEYHARRAIDLAPEVQEPYLHLGNALATSGRIEEAASALLKAVGPSPIGIMAMARLVHIRRVEPASPEFKFLMDMLDQAEAVPEPFRATIYFAAGKAFDDQKAYDRAFSAFEKGNRIHARLYPFDLAEFERASRRLIEVGTAASAVPPQRTDTDGATPIFICGLPRSGTTLLDQMFSRHPGVQSGGELRASWIAFQNNPPIMQALKSDAHTTGLDPTEIDPDALRKLGEDYMFALHSEGLRAGFITDKMPANYGYIGILAAALPRAKFLILRRNPLDCLLSNFFQDFGKNQPFTSTFRDLAGVYRTFDSAARHWCSALSGRVQEVSYEALVSETEQSLKDILQFTGLDWDDRVLSPELSFHQVSTASIGQVREPIYNHAVTRSQNYAKQILDLEKLLRH